ncbi:MAG: STAS domain-containing protein [Actinomycetota bacterium]
MPHVLEIRSVAPGVFELDGEFDIETVDVFEASVPDLLASEADVVLDLASLTFLDSTGVRAVLVLAERLGGRRVILRRAMSNVRRTLMIAGIDGQGGISVEP